MGSGMEQRDEWSFRVVWMLGLGIAAGVFDIDWMDNGPTFQIQMDFHGSGIFPVISLNTESGYVTFQNWSPPIINDN
jgi:hypothetical protein